MITQKSDVIVRNLAAVEAHFHSEATGEVDAAVALYTDDAIWEAPARGLIFQGKEAAAANYRRMFSSMRNIEFRQVQRFATEDRVVDDSILTFDLIGDGFVNAPLRIGSSVEIRLVHIFEMRDGKIARENAFEIFR
jgi:steroid delta-isomerase-like uncharacterized protein